MWYGGTLWIEPRLLDAMVQKLPGVYPQEARLFRGHNIHFAEVNLIIPLQTVYELMGALKELGENNAFIRWSLKELVNANHTSPCRFLEHTKDM